MGHLVPEFEMKSITLLLIIQQLPISAFNLKHPASWIFALLSLPDVRVFSIALFDPSLNFGRGPRNRRDEWSQTPFC